MNKAAGSVDGFYRSGLNEFVICQWSFVIGHLNGLAVGLPRLLQSLLICQGFVRAHHTRRAIRSISRMAAIRNGRSSPTNNATLAIPSARFSACERSLVCFRPIGPPRSLEPRRSQNGPVGLRYVDPSGFRAKHRQLFRCARQSRASDPKVHQASSSITNYQLPITNDK